jgi:hypothetical protein
MIELSNFGIKGDKDKTENMTRNLGSLRHKKFKVISDF